MDGTGAELDAITRDMDAATSAWAWAGYPLEGPIFEAREDVFRRLRVWNLARARRTSGIPDNRPPAVNPCRVGVASRHTHPIG